VLQTEAYRRWLGPDETAWTKRMSKLFRNERFVRNVYVEILARDK
jgi:hypothetical protein